MPYRDRRLPGRYGRFSEKAHDAAVQLSAGLRRRLIQGSERGLVQGMQGKCTQDLRKYFSPGRSHCSLPLRILMIIRLPALQTSVSDRLSVEGLQ